MAINRMPLVGRGWAATHEQHRRAMYGHLSCEHHNSGDYAQGVCCALCGDVDGACNCTPIGHICDPCYDEAMHS